jgi:hypothetical protein
MDLNIVLARGNLHIIGIGDPKPALGDQLQISGHLA